MRNLKNLPEENLLVLLKVGDVPAFEELYNRYWSKLYSAAYNRVRSREVAEEIVQDFFTSVWTNKAKLEIKGSFTAYTYTAIRNLIFKYFQKQYHARQYENSQALHSAGSDDSTEQLIYLNDLKRALDRQVADLPPKCQGVFNLSRREFKSNKEIASLLEISEKTVENHMTKALKILRLSVKNISLLPLLISSCFF